MAEHDDGPKEWVTVKVPKDDRDKVNEYAPGATYGDCLVAGAERLNDAMDSDDLHYLDVDVSPDEFAELVASSVAERVSEHIDTGDTSIDYAELSNRVADELEGRMR